MKHLFFSIVFLFLIGKLANAQSVTNIHFEQTGKQIVIYYDLSGEAESTWFIDVYCSQDGGKSWKSPLEKLSGAAGKGIKPGNNQKVMWDVLQERDNLEGEISFKVEATKIEEPKTAKTAIISTPVNKPTEKAVIKAPEKVPEMIAEKLNYSPEYYKYKKAKTGWLISALATAGIGTFSYLQAGSAYTKYKTATTDAASLHQKVKTFDTITPIAFGVAGFCAVEFILKAGKQSKAKRQSVTLFPQPLLNKGAVLAIVYTF